MCHLKTESLPCAESSGGPAPGVSSEAADWSWNVKEVGREGKGSGELAGDKGSKPKEEHSGSDSKVSDFRVGESKGSVDESEAGSTVSKGGDTVGHEVAIDEEMIDVDAPEEQHWRSELGNTGEPSGTTSSGLGLSGTETGAKKSPVLCSFGPVVAAASGHGGLEG